MKAAKYYIYPAIGIARVGNSESEYLISPEVINQKLDADVNYKDPATGKVKPQAARFRIYAINDEGRVIGEVTARDNVKIEWNVHIANRKPINYEFNNAMDLGKDLALDSTLRNPDIVDLEERRTKLLLDPGSRKIEGISREPANARGNEDFTFDSAKFYQDTAYEQDVYLGELRTDDKGRLLVLGGRGKSASFDGKPAITFANNQGWHDDVSDGTVRATVTIDGTAHEAEPAMVAVTPPNFAPGIQGTVTLLDVVENLFEDEGLIKCTEKVSFYRDINPIFQSLVDNQAVNIGFYFLFGENSPADFSTDDLLAKISSNNPENLSLRQYLFSQFRPSVSVAKKQREEALKDVTEQHKTNSKGLNLQVGKIALNAISASQEALQADMLPPFYGDAYGEYLDNPLANLSLTDRQYDMLERWAKGDFETGEPIPVVNSVEELPIAEQPAALTKGNLAQCLGGAFHPGIELTWFLRRISMWNTKDAIDPMRLNILPADQEPQDFFGPVLTPEVALAQMFNASGPGTLTRFMGLPWQTDEASCRSGQDYDPAFYLPLASFWSARVPNQVLSEKSFDRLNDKNLPTLQRIKHLDYRQDWLRFFNSTQYQTQINGMVQNWDKIGIVKKRELDTPIKVAGYELDTLWVESEVNKKFTVNDPSFRQLLNMENLDTSNSDHKEKLRVLEQDDCDFAGNAEVDRIRFTRKELFSGKIDD